MSEEPVSPHILTAEEAAIVLRCEATDPAMLQLLPAIDSYLGMGTGWDWSLDVPVNEMAKNAARILLVLWYENPGMVEGNYSAPLSPGFNACMTQLKVLAMELLETTGSA